jgi:hypothetical protein
MAGGRSPTKRSAVRLTLQEVQGLIACIIESLQSGKERSRDEKKSIAAAGRKLRHLEKHLQIHGR